MPSILSSSLWAVIGFPVGLLSYLFYILRRSNSSTDLKNKVVFITGASSGLGKACAEVFHKAGCRLVLSGRNVQSLLDLKDQLAKTNLPNTHTPAIVTIDLEDLANIPHKISQVIAAFGQVDIVINNAGQSYRGRVTDTQLDVDLKLMNVNYFGQIEVTKAILPHMIKRRDGQIVVIGSVQGKLSIPHRSSYAASKHALQAYFDCVRAEMAQHNIHVCVVNPYYISTNLSQNAVTGDGSSYGKMDDNTKSGLRPEFVAEQIFQCLIYRTQELTLAPLHVRLAICLRTLLPNFIFKQMVSRAKKESSLYVKDK